MERIFRKRLFGNVFFPPKNIVKYYGNSLGVFKYCVLQKQQTKAFDNENTKILKLSLLNTARW